MEILQPLSLIAALLAAGFMLFGGLISIADIDKSWPVPALPIGGVYITIILVAGWLNG